MPGLRLTPLPLGLTLVEAPPAADARGRFVKPFHAPSFAEAGLATQWAECYFSDSAPGVVRGLHYQAPPHHHAKLVWCTRGRVIDVALDLRAGPGFGQWHALELAAHTGQALYLPPGFAHGFVVPAGAPEPATLLYLVSTPYAPQADTGVRFDSVGFDWAAALGGQPPTLSPRDLALPPLARTAPLSL